MKTIVLKISSIASIVLMLLTASVWTSCKKDKTTHGKVTVVNGAGTAVSGATVYLAAPSANGQKSYTGTTDASGTTSFEIPLPGIWDVNVKKDSLTAAGVLRLDEPGKKDEIKVILR
jgi:hypothetical protein